MRSLFGSEAGGSGGNRGVSGCLSQIQPRA
jgi:hypothetical protein